MIHITDSTKMEEATENDLNPRKEYLMDLYKKRKTRAEPMKEGERHKIQEESGGPLQANEQLDDLNPHKEYLSDLFKKRRAQLDSAGTIRPAEEMSEKQGSKATEADQAAEDLASASATSADSVSKEVYEVKRSKEKVNKINE